MKHASDTPAWTASDNKTRGLLGCRALVLSAKSTASDASMHASLNYMLPRVWRACRLGSEHIAGSVFD
eukprot:1001010-Rhodomonas_salina.4